MYRFLKKFKKVKKPVKLTQNQVEEIIEFAKEKLEEEKVEKELMYILDKFPEICNYVLLLNERVTNLENITVIHV